MLGDYLPATYREDNGSLTVQKFLEQYSSPGSNARAISDTRPISPAVGVEPALVLKTISRYFDSRIFPDPVLWLVEVLVFLLW